jgi:hypothetical protein
MGTSFDNIPMGPDEPGGPRVTNLGSLGSPAPLNNLEITARDLANLIEIDVQRLDPAFKYRLVHKSRMKVGRRRAMGYITVDPDMEEIFHVSGERVEPAADNTYTFHDLVLMKVPRPEYRQRRKALQRRTEERLGGPKKAFKRKARSMRDRAGNEVEVITTKEPGGDPGSNKSRRRGR